MDDDSELLAAGDRTGVAMHAGFPNPAASLSGTPALSLDKLLVKHPSGTYLFRIRGNHWQEEGISDGDIAIVDRTVSPRAHDLVISWPDDAFALSRYQPDSRTDIWGTVAYIIHDYRPGATRAS